MMKLFMVILVMWMISAECKKIREEETPASNIVKIEEAPFIVSVGQEKHSCVGSIISTSWVITTAHCVISNNVSIYPGINERMKFLVNPDNKILVENIIRYPQNINGNGDDLSFYDIALLKLKTPLEISREVKTIELDTDPWPTKTFRECTAYSYGFDKYNNDFLRSAIFYVDDPKKSCACLSHPKLICGKPANLHDGTCIGESGGPLVCDGTLVGILSGGVNTKFCNVTAGSDSDAADDDEDKSDEAADAGSVSISGAHHRGHIKIEEPNCGNEDVVNIFGRIYTFNDWIDEILNNYTKRTLGSVDVRSNNCQDLQLSHKMLMLILIKSYLIF